MKKLTLMAALGGCTLALMTQGAWAFFDPNITPSGHGTARTSATQTSQISDALAYLNNSGYVVQGLAPLPDGNYSAQIVGPDAKVKNVQVLLQKKEIVDANGQALAPLMSADDAAKWLKQIGYTPQTFQIKDGKYVFTADDKSGKTENVSIDPMTKDLSIVGESSQ